MDFIDRIEDLGDRIPKQIEYCTTEEATKNALVLPFIQALGYDVFNPAEVMPEMTADYGTKKGEKVDYAILQEGKPIIVFECKRAAVDLGDIHASQLYRYFSVLPNVRFGVLTNGVIYQFYSDLDAPNRMDNSPFFVFDMFDFQERQVLELKKFTKSTFDLEEILETASELKYTAAIKRIINQEFDQPSDEFVAFLAKQVYSGRMTQSVREQFTEITQKALRRFLNERISDRLKSALDATGKVDEAVQPAEKEVIAEEEEVEGVYSEDRKRGIVTTEDEIEGYFAVKSILRDEIDIKRVHIRDTKSYCNVLLGDNNRKPICRLRFNSPQKYLGLINEEKQEERVPIADIDEIYEHAGRIIETTKGYDSLFGVPKPKVAKPTVTTSAIATSFTGTKPAAVTFEGHRYEVGTWREVLFCVLELLRSHNQAQFEKYAVTMVGRKRPYLTDTPSELRNPQPVPKTDLYAETNLDAQGIANICTGLAEKMGFDSSTISFDIST